MNRPAGTNGSAELPMYPRSPSRGAAVNYSEHRVIPRAATEPVGPRIAERALMHTTSYRNRRSASRWLDALTLGFAVGCFAWALEARADTLRFRVADNGVQLLSVHDG